MSVEGGKIRALDLCVYETWIAADGHPSFGFRPKEDLRDALAATVEAGICRRFTVTPCSERPELPKDQWCKWCRALAAVGRALDTEAQR